jgi:pyruvate dehydrogenase E2 component (dihydrolipoamide acetyltransferase)
MATLEFKLPDIGEGVTEGEMVQWLVKAGDAVNQDQPLAEVMTDKATVEIPSPTKGTVKELKVKPGDVIKVGAVMLVIETGGAMAAAPAPSSSASKGEAPAAAPKAATAAPAPAAKSSNGVGSNGHGDVHPPVAASHVLASPGTRRLARESGVDINTLKGTGPIGRVTRDDVAKGGGAGGGLETYSSGSPAKGAPGMSIPRAAYQGPQGALEERVPMRGIRRKIAEKMQLSKHIIPHFSLMDEANVTALVELREGLKAKAEKSGVKVTYLPFLMKAMIATMREFPKFNASIDDAAEEIVYKKYFNIGFAADTDNGLVVPVIKNADQKSILEISKEIVELSGKARANKLAPDDMKGGTISITNIGSIGGAFATPIINHPEVAILGMYKITDRLFLGKDGKVGSVKVMNLSITADHRLIDGAEAARFLKAFIERLENPGVLMLDLV